MNECLVPKFHIKKISMKEINRHNLGSSSTKACHLSITKMQSSYRKVLISWTKQNEDSKNKYSSTKWTKAKWCMWKQKEKQWSEAGWIIDERWALWYWNSTGKAKMGGGVVKTLYRHKSQRPSPEISVWELSVALLVITTSISSS